MITIKENDKPNLKKCQMKCDVPLDSKLDKYDLTKFLNCQQSTVICGRPQSGKTSLMYSLFKSKHILKGVYDKVFVFQPSSSRASMRDDLFGKLPPEQIFEELTLENLETVFAQAHEGNNCIVFDDMGAYLKNNEIRKEMKRLLMNRRHLHFSIYFLVQTWLSIERDIRKLFNNIIIFRCSKMEMEQVFQEVIESRAKHQDEIVKLVYDKPHEYLFCNLDSQRIFKGFDELLFPEE
jgi:hypothetical protein